MESMLAFLLDGRGLPHGYCIAWDSRLLWIMVASNSLVALAYFSIPIALWKFLRLQPQLPFRWIFVLFCSFIFACGLTHVIDIINIFRPAYRLDALMMSLTGIVSVATAATLFPLVPAASGFLDAAKQQGQALKQVSDELLEKNAALSSSEQRFRLTFQNAPIGLAMVSPEGRFMEVNEALCRIVDYSAEELIKLTFQQITHPDDLDRDLQQVQNLLAGKGANYRIQKRYFTRTGKIVSVQLDVSLQRDNAGLPMHFIAQIQDITARLESERILQKSEAEARVLSSLDGTLQACLTLQEIGPPAARALDQFYPHSKGVIYLQNHSKASIQQIYCWGEDAISEPSFSPADCWALRRGQDVSVALNDAHATVCPHIDPNPRPMHSLCLPMLAHGETVGLVHLQVPIRDNAALNERPAQQIAQRLSQAIGNLQLQETLRFQSLIDPLTELHNRRHLETSLGRDLARAERKQGTLAVLMIDVDHFKRFNDKYGHAAGDQVLREVGSVLAYFCRHGDLAARYGGEEFTVVLSDIDEHDALGRAEALRRQVSELAVEFKDQTTASITISVGVAMFPAHGHSPAKVLAAADKALYGAKRAGRNRVLSRTSQLRLEPEPADAPGEPATLSSEASRRDA